METETANEVAEKYLVRRDRARGEVGYIGPWHRGAHRPVFITWGDIDRRGLKFEATSTWPARQGVFDVPAWLSRSAPDFLVTCPTVSFDPRVRAGSRSRVLPETPLVMGCRPATRQDFQYFSVTWGFDRLFDWFRLPPRMCRPDLAVDRLFFGLRSAGISIAARSEVSEAFTPQEFLQFSPRDFRDEVAPDAAEETLQRTRHMGNKTSNRRTGSGATDPGQLSDVPGRQVLTLAAPPAVYANRVRSRPAPFARRGFAGIR